MESEKNNGELKVMDSLEWVDVITFLFGQILSATV